LALLGNDDLIVMLHVGTGGEARWATFQAIGLFGRLIPLQSGRYPREKVYPRSMAVDGTSTLHVLNAAEHGESEVATFMISADGTLTTLKVRQLWLSPLGLCLTRPGELAFLIANQSAHTLEVISGEDAASSLTHWVSPTLTDIGALHAADLTCHAGSFYVAVSNGTHVFITMTGVVKWKLVGVGRHVSLSAAVDLASNETVLGLVNDGGFCYNSESHNKLADLKVCDRIPRRCPTNLDYTAGPVQDWVEFVNGELDFATPCGILLHGTYDFGFTPSLSMVSMANSVALLAVHEGLSFGQHTCSSCGIPAPKPGKLILDGFLLT